MTKNQISFIIIRCNKSINIGTIIDSTKITTRFTMCDIIKIRFYY